jgi:hypothetical protein
MLSERKRLMFILFAASLFFLSLTGAYARDQMSIHVLFTGNVGGRLEPSG